MKKYINLLFILGISFNLFSQKPFNKIVVDDQIISCNNPLDINGCYVFKPRLTDVKKTTSYEVSSIPYTPFPKTGTKINLAKDDTFSNLVPIGFKFDFYNKTYENVAVSDNGIISFTQANAGENSPYNVTGQIPSINLPRNAILAPFQDLSIRPSFGCTSTNCGEVKYQTVGTAPFRRFIVTYDDVSMFNCPTRSTTQVVLYETFNEVDIFLESRPLSCARANESEAVIGIQNEEGPVVGTSPPNRNSGDWQATNEAWNFKPNAAQTGIKYEWTEKGQSSVLSTDRDATLCPKKKTTYIAKSHYTLVDGTKVTFEDEFEVVFDLAYPIANEAKYEFCSPQPSTTIDLLQQDIQGLIFNGQIGLQLSFHTTEQDARNNIPLSSTNINFSDNNPKVFYFRLQRSNGCFSIDKLTIKKADDPENNVKTPIKICDILNDNQENINLKNTLDVLIAGSQVVDITYHVSLANAQANTFPITTYNVTPTTKRVFVRISRNNQCPVESFVDFDLLLNPSSIPDITIPTLCDENNDGIEIYDFIRNNQSSVPGASTNTITYYANQLDAINNTNPIDGSKINVNTTIFTFYIRSSNSNGCFSMAKVSTGLKPGFSANHYDFLTKCDLQGDGEAFDLRLAIPNMIQNQNDYIIEYYTKVGTTTTKLTQAEVNNYIQLPGNGLIRDIGTIYVKFINKTTNCVLEKEIRLPVGLVPKAAVTTINSPCAKFNGDEVTTPLPKNHSGIIKDQILFDIDWFLTQQNAINNSGAISQIKMTSDVDVWVRMYRTETNCFAIEKIKIKYIVAAPIDVVPEITLDVCDKLNDGIEEMNLNNLINLFRKCSGDTSTYFGKNLVNDNVTNPISPINFNVFDSSIKESNNVFVIYAQTSSAPCGKGITKIIFNKKNLNHQDANVTVCNRTTVNLDSDEFLKESSSDWNNYTRYFYTTFESARDNVIADRINPSNITLNKGVNEYFVRMEDSTTPDTPPMFTNNNNLVQTIKLCNSNNQGFERILIANLTNRIFGNTLNSSHVVEYYQTFKDAVDGTNKWMNSIATFANNTPFIVKLIENNVCKNIFRLSFELSSDLTTCNQYQPITSKACYSVKKLIISNYDQPKIQKDKLDVCDFLRDGVENNFNLSTLDAQIIGTQTGLTVAYFTTLSDATNNTNPITTANLIPTSSLYVRLFVDTCLEVGKITFNFVSSPLNKVDVSYQICDNNDDLKEIVDLDVDVFRRLLVNDNIINYTYEYFVNQTDAVTGTNKIINFNAYEITPQNNIVYVRIYNAAFCYSISKLTIIFGGSIKARDTTPPKKWCDYLNDNSEFIDLTQYISEMIDDETGIKIDYFETEQDANTDKENPPFTIPSGNLTRYEVSQVITNIYVRFFSKVTKCYTVRRILLDREAPPKVPNFGFTKYDKNCDINRDGTFDIDLTKLPPLLLVNYADYKYYYYRNQIDATKDENRIESTDVTNFQVDRLPFQVFVVPYTDVCRAVTSVILEANKLTSVTSDVFNFDTECDDDFDGKIKYQISNFRSRFTLSPTAVVNYYRKVEDADNNTNPILDLNTYEIENGKKIFLRIEEPGFCPKVVDVNIVIKPLPVISLPETVKYCANEFATVNASVPGITNPNSYVWDHGKIGQEISENIPGTYTVTVSAPNGCSAKKSTNLIAIKLPQIIELAATATTIKVTANSLESPPPYLYSISYDNGTTWSKWQTNDTFEELPPGRYTFRVRSTKTGCISNSKSTMIFNITNVITPNGDGVNDVWRVSDLDISAFEGLESELKIYDRYGKVVFTQKSNKEFVWNGAYLDRTLPGTSYWYEINFPDGRKYTGYILVKALSGVK